MWLPLRSLLVGLGRARQASGGSGRIRPSSARQQGLSRKRRTSKESNRLWDRCGHRAVSVPANKHEPPSRASFVTTTMSTSRTPMTPSVANTIHVFIDFHAHDASRQAFPPFKEDLFVRNWHDGVFFEDWIHTCSTPHKCCAASHFHETFLLPPRNKELLTFLCIYYCFGFYTYRLRHPCLSTILVLPLKGKLRREVKNG